MCCPGKMDFTRILVILLSAAIHTATSQKAEKTVTPEQENYVLLKGADKTLTLKWRIANEKRLIRVTAKGIDFWGVNEDADVLEYWTPDAEQKYGVEKMLEEDDTVIVLTIKDFTSDDVGSYMCSLPLKAIKSNINVFEVDCSTAVPEGAVLLDQEGQFVCKTHGGSGAPYPVLSWDDATPSSNTEDSNTLEFTATEQLMGKEATCTAKIGTVATICTHPYDITAPYTFKEITSDPLKGSGDMLVETRNKVTLTCQVEGTPTPKFSWTVNQVTMSDIEHNSTLIIDTKDYSKVKDFTVMCMATTQSGVDIGEGSYHFLLKEPVEEKGVTDGDGGAGSLSAGFLLQLSLVLLAALLH